VKRFDKVNYFNRTHIGLRVIDEPDEVLKMIYAQLVRTMVEFGTEIKLLFPQDYDKTMYKNFPIECDDNDRLLGHILMNWSRNP
jgi:hypothetical protein